MHCPILRSIGAILLTLSIVQSVSAKNLTVEASGTGILTVRVESNLHREYGLAYPFTCEILVPPGSSGLRARLRYNTQGSWRLLQERHAGDFVNGQEMVRFDYPRNVCYVSVSFEPSSDMLQVSISDAGGNQIPISFLDFCKYYDNRKACVTISADDWRSNTDMYFLPALARLRSKHLEVSVGIVTDSCDQPTWQSIQHQLDSGMVEAASHSRKHQDPPYDDPVSEIFGSRDDIIQHLNLPSFYRSGQNEYVYTWISPYGVTNESINQLVGEAKYLINRTTAKGYITYADWDPATGTFFPCGVTTEMGPLFGGLTDVDQLNGKFDNAVAAGGIYYMMMHPSVLGPYGEWSKPYTTGHLDHISNRTDIWYATLGSLYLYRFMTMSNSAAAPSGNVLSNGSFEEGRASWTFYTNGAGSFTTVSPGSAGTQAARIDIATAGSNVQLYQQGVALVPDADYTLSFDAYCTSGHDLNVSLLKHGTPYTDYGLSDRRFDLGTSWRSYSVTFHTKGFSSSVSDGRLMFWFAPYDAAGDAYLIDNVVLTRPGGSAPKIAAPAAETAGEAAPAGFAVAAPFPNPWNSATTVRFSLPEPSTVVISIISMLGQEVVRLADGYYGAGVHEVTWGGIDNKGVHVGSGAFIVLLRAGGRSGEHITAVEKIVLVK
jgi:hypothetical protein